MDDFWAHYTYVIEQATLILILYYLTNYNNAHYDKNPRNNDPISGELYIQNLLRHGHEQRIHDVLRMPLHTFKELHAWLIANTQLQDTRITAFEKLVMFIQITGHGWSYRDVEERFQHSLDTISR
jgi:hypothetical protein